MNKLSKAEETEWQEETLKGAFLKSCKFSFSSQVYFGTNILTSVTSEFG